ncbi:hypothetical protein A6A06_18250 [Streptomyces sp. CB02923]|uniref:hypothetical protein n=1 Tax=Streptomyces sp. CB02923 TaxID=1718985 RepID=UPI000939CCE1|nr:hypothetical protein [Streptomyces sp. CB02923]OKI01371.1 hypothetical protein A6A06_18250 [Streptomyces sp. CB02923]
MPRVRRRPLIAAFTALAVCAGTALALGAAAPEEAGAAAPHRAVAAPAGGGAAAALPHTARPARHSADEPSVTGTGKLQRQPGDDAYISLDAHGLADKAHGTFFVSHHAGKEWGGHFKGRIDCLLTGGPVAVATGVVTESRFTDAPGFPQVGDLKGKRFGFTVLDDGGKDRIGYSWAMDNLPRNSVGKCQSSAPFETLAKGGFKVRHRPPFPSARG